MIRHTFCALMICAQAASAAPEVSKRPVLRENTAAVAPVAPQQEAVRERKGLGLSLRPLFRGRKAEREARKSRKLREKGAICGDIALQGVPVGRVPGSIQGCGVQDAVRVRSVSGIALSQSSVMDCGTANALKTWVEDSAKPALARQGGGLVGLKVAAHYACRTRNNRKGARISEHGKGRAIDISGFELANGNMITVLEGWNARRTRSALRKMHQGACGPFGTVLGPQADRFHRDHFHFDTARYRSGSYCR